MDALKPIELTYRGVNRARRFLYRRRILRQQKLERPVISIGNRAIGGSGKTPTVIAVVRGLIERGLRPAVLTRGYGRSSREEPLRVDAPDAARYGDEPVLIAAALGDVPVIVGADRARAARWFLADGECDVFLLDDGFQHLQLARDVDLVLETPAARWHREGPSSLADADVLLVRDGAAAGVPEDRPKFAVRLRPTSWIAGAGSRPLDELRGRAAVAVAGLADNAQFFAMLRSLGLDLREEITFPDHHLYDAADLERIERARAAASASIVLTTEKDLVKIGSEAFGALRVSMEIENEEALFDLLLARIGGGEFREPADGLWRR